jgi:hypothetical protein
MKKFGRINKRFQHRVMEFTEEHRGVRRLNFLNLCNFCKHSSVFIRVPSWLCVENLELKTQNSTICFY